MKHPETLQCMLWEGSSPPMATQHRRFQVLIVEGEEHLRRLLALAMKREGYGTVTACDGVQAMARFCSDPVDLMLLDLELPRTDGFQLCRELRKRSSVPIIALTALGGINRRIRALEVGADAYMTKPVPLPVLAARIRALLRRTNGTNGRLVGEHVLEAGAIRLDAERYEAMIQGEPVHLTPLQFKLLRLLMENAGRPMPKETLLEKVWDDWAHGGTNIVEVAIYRLRQKIERNSSLPKHIVTVPGIGYKFTTHED